MKALQRILTTILATSACLSSTFADAASTGEASPNEFCNFTITDAWVRPAQNNNTALYMKITANTEATKDATLNHVSVYSKDHSGNPMFDIANNVELHSTSRDPQTDAIKMHAESSLPLTNGVLVLAPQQTHIMLMDLKKPLVETAVDNPTTIQVRLNFSDGSTCYSEAVVSNGPKSGTMSN